MEYRRQGRHVVSWSTACDKGSESHYGVMLSLAAKQWGDHIVQRFDPPSQLRGHLGGVRLRRRCPMR
eukprot:14005198-Alexandrium_andersonii.AAC.1